MGILVSVVLPLALAFIMFSLGVGLTIADFTRFLKRPTAFVVGALNQVILLPIVTFIVILIFGIKGELAVGLMILSACPGGVTSNMVAKIANADVALSVSLTAVISLLSAITVPVILVFALGRFMAGSGVDVDITKTAITMFAITVVPVAIGVGLRAMFPGGMARAERAIGLVALVLFVVIVLAALAANWGLFVENLAALGPVLLVLLILLTAIGFVVPRLLGRPVMEAKTVSIETGVQNATLGIAVAGIIAGSVDGFSAFALPSAVYGILMYLILVPVIFIYRRMD